MIPATPDAPPPAMPRSAADGWNMALASIIALADASAAALRTKLVERPTRFNHAIGALEAIADEARAMIIGALDPEAAAATADGPGPTPDAPVDIPATREVRHVAEIP